MRGEFFTYILHPVCYSGQTSVVCITHRVFFLGIRKHTLNRLFALGVQLLSSFCFSECFHQVQMLLPDVACV